MTERIREDTFRRVGQRSIVKLSVEFTRTRTRCLLRIKQMLVDLRKERPESVHMETKNYHRGNLRTISSDVVRLEYEFYVFSRRYYCCRTSLNFRLLTRIRKPIVGNSYDLRLETQHNSEQWDKIDMINSVKI